jgi:hypothetical protein
MEYTKINVAIATPTKEMAQEYLKKILGDEYIADKENNVNSLIYSSNLLDVFWVEEFAAPIIQRRYTMIYCRPNALNSQWFDYCLSPCGVRGFGLIEETEEEANE